MGFFVGAPFDLQFILLLISSFNSMEASFSNQVQFSILPKLYDLTKLSFPLCPNYMTCHCTCLFLNQGYYNFNIVKSWIPSNAWIGYAPIIFYLVAPKLVKIILVSPKLCIRPKICTLGTNYQFALCKFLQKWLKGMV